MNLVCFVNICKGTEILEKAGGLHGFMNWKRALLTVSCSLQTDFRQTDRQVYLESYTRNSTSTTISK